VDISRQIRVIILRLANESDLPLMLAWRNHELVRQGMYTQGFSNPHLITWQEHLSWWKSRNKDWRTFIIELKEDDILRPVGVVTISQLDNWNSEIGLYVGEITLWGQSVGARALYLALEWLREYGCRKVHTTILKNNPSSRALFKKMGFEEIGKAREGEIAVELYLI